MSENSKMTDGECTTTGLRPIYPGNVFPDHYDMVNVIVKSENGHYFQAQDCKLGRRNWMYWKHVVAWQEKAASPTI